MPVRLRENDGVTIALQLLAALGFAMLIVTVHEHGHLLVARAAGVPADDVRVDLDRRPPVVLLRHRDQWLGPEDPGYVDTFRSHRPSATAAWCFVMGGLVVETMVTSVAVAVLLLTGLDPVARVVASTSAVLFLVYLLADVTLTARHGPPYGDHTAAWRIAGTATVAAILVVALVKAAGVLLST